ncbi:MAG: formylglycine-generating enzyme family protein, partial [Parvibaculales bacterium]
EWEYAARGGANHIYAWGDNFLQNGVFMANSWQGSFPNQDLGEDGFVGIAPIGCFPSNRFGLYDMIGNVWEWTKEVYSPNRQNLTSNKEKNEPFVIKGGSFLCAPNYCIRYRPAARQPQESSLGTNHLGFRTIKRISQSPPPKQSF